MLLLWPLTTMKMKRQRSTCIRRERKCRQISPNNMPGKVLTGPSLEKWKIQIFSWTFIIVMSQNGQGASFAGRCGNVHVVQQVWKDRVASREGRVEGWVLFPPAFHYLPSPINTSISGVSKQRGENGNESRASRHALAAISVVRLVGHTGCHHGQREPSVASVSLKQRVFVICLARLHGGWSHLGGCILCFTADGWPMFGGKWRKENKCEK